METESDSEEDLAFTIKCSDGTVPVSSDQARNVFDKCDYFRNVFRHNTNECVGRILTKPNWTVMTATIVVELLTTESLNRYFNVEVACAVHNAAQEILLSVTPSLEPEPEIWSINWFLETWFNHLFEKMESMIDVPLRSYVTFKNFQFPVSTWDFLVEQGIYPSKESEFIALVKFPGFTVQTNSSNDPNSKQDDESNVPSEKRHEESGDSDDGLEYDSDVSDDELEYDTDDSDDELQDDTDDSDDELQDESDDSDDSDDEEPTEPNMFEIIDSEDEAELGFVSSIPTVDLVPTNSSISKGSIVHGVLKCMHEGKMHESSLCPTGYYLHVPCSHLLFQGSHRKTMEHVSTAKLEFHRDFPYDKIIISGSPQEIRDTFRAIPTSIVQSTEGTLRLVSPSIDQLNPLIVALNKCKNDPVTMGLDGFLGCVVAKKTLEDIAIMLDELCKTTHAEKKEVDRCPLRAVYRVEG